MESHLFKIDTWEMFKGIIAGMWFMLTIFWQIWVLLLIVVLIRIFLGRWLPDYIYKKRVERYRKRVESNFKQGEK